MLDLIMGGMSLLNTVKSNKRANQAANEQSALTAAEIARNEKIMELYAQGSTEMKNAMEGVLDEAGSFAEITPENFVALRNYFTSERKQEDLQNENDVYEADNRRVSTVQAPSTWLPTWTEWRKSSSTLAWQMQAEP